MRGVCPSELEEVPMPIVGGLDIHRKQITFDYLVRHRLPAAAPPRRRGGEH